MKVAIYGRMLNTDASAEALQTLVSKLEKARIDFLIYEPFLNEVVSSSKSPPYLKMGMKGKGQVFSTHQDIKGKVKFLFSIGGDGTLLETVTLVHDSGIPVMGINTGRLGFLSSISKDEIEIAVDAVLKGKYTLEKRILLQLETKDEGRRTKNKSEISIRHLTTNDFALNEIAVLKTDTSSMITIHASLNGKFLNSYWADGLIVATPTGSTAYSLSCGGPIVMPDSDNFVITPIAPHNLNVRPIIVSSHDVVTLEVESRHGGTNFLVSLDSRSKNVQPSSKLIIKKAGFLIFLVKLDSHDFLSTLRSKLMWGADKRN